VDDTLTVTDITIRLLSALACGAVIGLNRDMRGKPAGFRTFGLVAVGSAVVVILMNDTTDTGADALSRVIQGVLTGIGFLGAGVIFHRHRPAKIAGLTTAAAVWVTAGLGMAAGAGQLTLTWIALAVSILLLVLGGPSERLLDRLVRRRRRTKSNIIESGGPKGPPPDSPAR
jgi:putative Mg2+ transporter-C (MgtC) family protein